jgi:hypothetical protein
LKQNRLPCNMKSGWRQVLVAVSSKHFRINSLSSVAPQLVSASGHIRRGGRQFKSASRYKRGCLKRTASYRLWPTLYMSCTLLFMISTIRATPAIWLSGFWSTWFH